MALRKLMDNPTAKRWLIPEAAPIVGAVAVGVGMGTAMIVKNMSSHNDICLNHSKEPFPFLDTDKRSRILNPRGLPMNKLEQVKRYA